MPHPKRQSIRKPGRYAVTFECVDNLTEDEIITLQARLEVELCMLQRNHRGYTAEHAAAWKHVA